MAFIDQREIKEACSSEVNAPKDDPYFDKIFSFLSYEKRRSLAAASE